MAIATTTSTRMTKIRRVVNLLRQGKTLTANQAASRYGVKNLRAMISTIREEFEKYGNWEVRVTKNSRGSTVYQMVDTHPGVRTYGFDKNGRRTKLA
jgi:hypothetical protein